MHIENSHVRTETEAQRGVFFRYELLPERRMSYISETIADWAGFTPDELLCDAALFFDMIHPDDRFGFMQALSGAPGAGSRKVRWMRKNGSSYGVDLTILPVESDEGSYVAFEGVAERSESRSEPDSGRGRQGP